MCNEIEKKSLNINFKLLFAFRILDISQASVITMPLLNLVFNT